MLFFLVLALTSEFILKESKLFHVIMEESLIMDQIINYVSYMACCFVFHAHILLLKMVVLNEKLDLSTIWFKLFFIMPLSLLPFGMACKWLPTFITYFHANGSTPFPKRNWYDHLRTFGCLCYTLHPSPTIHNGQARHTPCVFLGYLLNHRGYI